MRIISVKKLKDFWEAGYADSETSLKVWYQLVKQNNFEQLARIKELFPSCSFVGNNRVVSMSTKKGPENYVKKGPLKTDFFIPYLPPN